MIAALLVAVAAIQDAAPSVPSVAKPVVTIEPAPIAVPLVSAMSPDHQRLAVETRDDGVWILNLTTRAWDLRIKPMDPHTIDIAWSATGAKLALLGGLGQIAIVDASNGRVVSAIHGQPRLLDPYGPCDLMAFAAQDEVLVAGLGDTEAEIWNVKTGKRIAAIRMRPTTPPTSFATSRDGRLLALGNREGDVGIWTTSKGEPVATPVTIPGAKRFGTAINSLDFDPDGSSLAIGGGDCTVRIWRFESATPMREFSLCDNDWGDGLAIGCVRFDDAGSKLLATSFPYWYARVWDVPTGAVVRQFRCEGENRVAMPAWFTVNDTAVTLSGGMCTRGILLEANPPMWSGDQPIPLAGTGFEQSLGLLWYRCDSTFAWTFERQSLVVRRIQDASPVVVVPIRAHEAELPAEATPAKGAGAK